MVKVTEVTILTLEVATLQCGESDSSDYTETGSSNGVVKVTQVTTLILEIAALQCGESESNDCTGTGSSNITVW